MNDAMQRMLPAILLALTLHGALLSWRMQLPETVQPTPLARKISVSLKRLPPPPPLKKIIQETPALPQIAPAEHQSVRPLELQPGKKIAAVPPLLPKIAQVKHQAVRPLELKPGKRVAAAPAPLPKISQVNHQAIQPLELKPGKRIADTPAPLPKLAPVTRQAIKPLAVQPVKRTEAKIVRTPVVPTPVRSTPLPRSVQQVRPVTQPRPVISRQQPVTRRTIRRTIAYQRTRQQPVRTKAQPTRHIPTTQATPPVSNAVVREAAPLYKTNPPPNYPRMARRRGLEGVVTIEAKIDINGKVADLRIFAGSGHKILDTAALKAVRGWQFSPGTVGGRAQLMWVKVPVRFELH